MMPAPLAMFRPYSEVEYQARERLVVALACVSLVWLFVAFPLGWSAGLLSSLAAVFTGAIFGCYSSRHTEPGVWMLALFLGVLIVGFYLLVVVAQILDAIRNRTSPWWVAVDASVAGSIVAVAMRASWTVVLQNRTLADRK